MSQLRHFDWEKKVSARHKLNAASVHGSTLIAALIGWLFGSWLVFLLAVAVLIATSLHAGDIRPGQRRR